MGGLEGGSGQWAWLLTFMVSWFLGVGRWRDLVGLGDLRWDEGVVEGWGVGGSGGRGWGVWE